MGHGHAQGTRTHSRDDTARCGLVYGKVETRKSFKLGIWTVFVINQNEVFIKPLQKFFWKWLVWTGICLSKERLYLIKTNSCKIFLPYFMTKFWYINIQAKIVNCHFLDIYFFLIYIYLIQISIYLIFIDFFVIFSFKWGSVTGFNKEKFQV